MNKYIVIFSFLWFSSSLYATEPSAFGAGDLESANPYGLTKSEKVILENKKITLAVKDKSLKNADSIKSLRDSLDGLKSVFEGTNALVGSQKKKILELQQQIEIESNNNKNLQQQIDELKLSINNSTKVMEENFDSFKKIMSELSSLVDSINNTYITKQKYKEDMDLLISKINKSIEANSRSKYEDMPGAKLLDKAVKAFRKKEYTASKKMFLALIDKNYKPARSNYYIGEINYYQAKYKDAISRYKISIGLYDKATYTPILLLHTAISFKKLKDSVNANKFFDVLESNYPDSKEAALIKKYR